MSIKAIFYCSLALLISTQMNLHGAEQNPQNNLSFVPFNQKKHAALVHIFLLQPQVKRPARSTPCTKSAAENNTDYSEALSYEVASLMKEIRPSNTFVAIRNDLHQQSEHVVGLLRHHNEPFNSGLGHCIALDTHALLIKWVLMRDDEPARQHILKGLCNMICPQIHTLFLYPDNRSWLLKPEAEQLFSAFGFKEDTTKLHWAYPLKYLRNPGSTKCTCSALPSWLPSFATIKPFIVVGTAVTLALLCWRLIRPSTSATQ